MNLSRAIDLNDVSIPAVVAPVRPGPGVSSDSVFSRPLIPIATAIIVAVLTLLATRLGHAGAPAAVFWAANAVAAGVWLRIGRGATFDLAFGGLMACGIAAGQFLVGHSPRDAGLLTVANTLEIIAAVVLVRRFAPGLAIVSVQSALRVLAALIAASAATSALGGICLYLVFGLPIVTAIKVWGFGHVLGLMTVTPFLLSLDNKILAEFRRPARMADAILLIVGVAIMAYVIAFKVQAPLAFLMNPVLLVVAARLKVAGLSIAMIAVSIITLGSLVHGHGPPGTQSFPLDVRVLISQLTLITAYIPYVLVAALIEERDRLWAQARAGLARAERASEAKSRLLANVAHEIKSPVAGVIGIGEMWSSGKLGPVNPTQTEMAEMLVRTARQVEALAHDLLDVARAEAGTVKVETRPTEIVSLVEDVRRMAMLRAEARGVDIRVEAEAPSHLALVDSQRLRQVIDNLAVNGLKYGGSGGRLDLRVMSCPLGVRIEVADQGPGLSKEKQAQLFEPFNRLGLERSKIEGHGVGLALALRLVELQGGEIGVDSTEGEGATFWVEVPAA